MSDIFECKEPEREALFGDWNKLIRMESLLAKLGLSSDRRSSYATLDWPESYA
ncbi:hypothetical protein PHLCEN_2v5049 [Hermanssonia centrifuga]|uniref:Uncharacterized protein n=1 Tax=Hermanssonia centrifuga TaxID=98765 RepID=A0A2R6PC76_9APHY|nr:hypothetical protein PHLCEN_2v5049 [Hermanssonia centrifuga]